MRVIISNFRFSHLNLIYEGIIDVINNLAASKRSRNIYRGSLLLRHAPITSILHWTMGANCAADRRVCFSRHFLEEMNAPRKTKVCRAELISESPPFTSNSKRPLPNDVHAYLVVSNQFHNAFSWSVKPKSTEYRLSQANSRGKKFNRSPASSPNSGLRKNRVVVANFVTAQNEYRPEEGRLRSVPEGQLCKFTGDNTSQ